MKRFFLFLLGLFLIYGTATAQENTKEYYPFTFIDKVDTLEICKLEIRIFQTQEKLAGLACKRHTNSKYIDEEDSFWGDVVYYITDSDDLIYDGKIIKISDALLIGTFSYITTQKVFKTVPIYTKKEVYKNLLLSGQISILKTFTYKYNF